MPSETTRDWYIQKRKEQEQQRQDTITSAARKKQSALGQNRTVQQVQKAKKASPAKASYQPEPVKAYTVPDHGGIETQTSQSKTALQPDRAYTIASGGELQQENAFDALINAAQSRVKKPVNLRTESSAGKDSAFPAFSASSIRPGTESVSGVDTIPYGASRQGAKWNAGDYLKAAGNAAWGTVSTLSNSIVNAVEAVDSLAAQGFGALTGYETGPVLKPVYDFYEGLDEDTQKKVEEDIQAGRMNKTVYNLLNGLVQQIPTIAIGLLTGGASTAGQAAGAVASNSSALAAGIKQLPELFKNPQFLWSFIQSFGGTYGDAVKNGADPAQAFLAGVVDALPESAIEVGGGLEAAMAEGPATNWKDFSKRWLRSAVEEAGEEIRQDPFSGLAQMTYDPDVEIFSMSDPEAVLNPGRAAESAASAFLTSLISGGVGTGISSYQAIHDTGTQIVGSGGTKDLLLAARLSADTNVRNRADQLIRQQMDGKELSVTDVGRLAWDAANAAQQNRSAGARKSIQDEMIDVLANDPLKDGGGRQTPQYRMVDYNDQESKQALTRQIHDDMVGRGKTVELTDADLQAFADYYPDLRSMKKSERTAILKEKKKQLIPAIKEMLHTMFDGKKVEFTVDGGILEARVYNEGITHVVGKMSQEKAAMLRRSQDIFRQAEYLYSTGNDVHGTASSNPDIRQWHYFYVPLKLGDQTVGVRIAVKEANRLDYPSIYDWDIKRGSHDSNTASSLEGTSTLGLGSWPNGAFPTSSSNGGSFQNSIPQTTGEINTASETDKGWQETNVYYNPVS